MMRIVSLLPTGTEMLAAVGAADRIVGRSEHCVFPEPVTARPVVVRSLTARQVPKNDSRAIHEAVRKLRLENRHQFQIDVEALKELRPDLIVAQKICSVCAASHAEVEEAVAALPNRPEVVYLNAGTFAEIFSEMRGLGARVGLKQQADRVVLALEERKARVEEKTAGIERSRVWCCEWMEPLMAAGHWIPEMIAAAGGTDGLAQPGASSRWLNWSDVIAYDPEVVITMPCSYTIEQTLAEKELLTKRPGWEKLTAVKNSRVFAADTELLHHAGPRLLEGLELFAHLIHPELFPKPAGKPFRPFA
ncbi:MAG: cobalamin-binding protein [Candidatus Omnitrophica bacterium CG11_big_fil_rev_8_21_14_0_20_64_10]|nr:MAG: cobalamin-binding protein [Candidatus Omnitrophica bacterium CG11_big_fil_rev_8_21_14_0_20_64_10]